MMVLAVMLSGLASVINFTMLGAMAQLLSSVPDSSFAAIVSGWFGRGSLGEYTERTINYQLLVHVKRNMERKGKALLLLGLPLGLLGLTALATGISPRARPLLPWGILLVASSVNLLVIRAFTSSLRRRLDASVRGNPQPWRSTLG
jgi:hypothetical protein